MTEYFWNPDDPEGSNPPICEGSGCTRCTMMIEGIACERAQNERSTMVKKKKSSDPKVVPMRDRERSLEARKEPKKEPKKNERIIPVTRHLKRKLTREEVESRSDEAAHCRADIKTEEANLATVKSQFKARIEERTGRMDRLLGEVSSKCTYEDVDCHEIWDYSEKIVRVVRLDTNEETERRDMTRGELQLSLPEKKAPAADGTEKMGCHDKPSKEAVEGLKKSAKERLEEEGDQTESELKARAKKQKLLLDEIDAAEETQEQGEQADRDIELEDDENDDETPAED